MSNYLSWKDFNVPLIIAVCISSSFKLEKQILLCSIDVYLAGWQQIT